VEIIDGYADVEAAAEAVSESDGIGSVTTFVTEAVEVTVLSEESESWRGRMWPSSSINVLATVAARMETAIETLRATMMLETVGLGLMSDEFGLVQSGLKPSASLIDQFVLSVL
jgi:hypothetical protein